MCDVLIIGGGIVGLATAYQLTRRYPALKVVILEKEAEVAKHQTGHNSGVLHSGIYYRPGSLRALNCRTGKMAMEQFCREEGIPFDICGKVIVAIDEAELPLLAAIYDRGLQNGVRCERIDQARLLEIEPHVAGIAAIHVPEAGIVDYASVARRLAQIVQERGSEVITSARVTGMRHGSMQVVVESTAGEFTADYVVNCAGLYSDRVARLSGAEPDAQIIPFRGEYYDVVPAAQHLCRNLIYPVPNPEFPFLGVHFTRTIHGHLECGPNAVLAFAREGYSKDIVNLGDLLETITHTGFVRMAIKYWRDGLMEMWRSFSRPAFLAALQRLIPSIRDEDITPAPAGVRAQAIASAGHLIDDFSFLDHGRVVNVCNAPSPAATSSLNVGQLVVDRLAKKLEYRL